MLGHGQVIKTEVNRLISYKPAFRARLRSRVHLLRDTLPRAFDWKSRVAMLIDTYVGVVK
jgi:hypothetical protein